MSERSFQERAEAILDEWFGYAPSGGSKDYLIKPITEIAREADAKIAHLTTLTQAQGDLIDWYAQELEDRLTIQEVSYVDELRDKIRRVEDE